jgi:hypothetical protein
MEYDLNCQWCGNGIIEEEYIGEDHEFVFCCHSCEDKYYEHREAKGNNAINRGII